MLPFAVTSVVKHKSNDAKRQTLLNVDIKFQEQQKLSTINLSSDTFRFSGIHTKSIKRGLHLSSLF